VKLFSRLEDRLVGGPSILAANCACLADEVRKAEEGGTELMEEAALEETSSLKRRDNLAVRGSKRISLGRSRDHLGELVETV
jgi:hypothetical protein